VEPAAGSEGGGPDTLLSSERSGNSLDLEAHEHDLPRERPAGPAGTHIDSFIVDASISRHLSP
jgi:hypothetical protein